MPIFRVKSVTIYTGRKNLHWRRQPRQRQLSGINTPYTNMPFFNFKQWIVLKVICLFPAAPYCLTWKNKNSRNKILSYLFWSWFRKGCFKFESSSEEFRRAPFCWQLRMSILLKSRSDDDRKGLLSVCPPAPLPNRGAFFVWRAPILSWPRIMCSQVCMLTFLESSREMP